MFSYSRVECCPFRLQVCRQCNSSLKYYGKEEEELFTRLSFETMDTQQQPYGLLVNSVSLSLSLSLDFWSFLLIVLCVVQQLYCSSLLFFFCFFLDSFSGCVCVCIVSFVMFSFCLSSVFPPILFLFFTSSSLPRPLFRYPFSQIHLVAQRTAVYINLSGRFFCLSAPSLTERCCAFH